MLNPRNDPEFNITPKHYPPGHPKCQDIYFLHYLFVWLHPSIYQLALYSSIFTSLIVIEQPLIGICG